MLRILPAAGALFMSFVALLPFSSNAQTAFGNALSATNNGTVAVALPAAIPSNYTISSWVFLRSGTAGFEPGSGLLSAEDCGSSIELLLRGPGASSAQVIELGRCNYFFGGMSSGTVPINQWTHVAVTVSSANNVLFYINGQPSGAWNAAGFDLSIGPVFNLAHNGFRRFNGIVDDFSIWTNALSQAEIGANMYQPLTGSEPGLFLYYRFDSAAGTMATNSAAATVGSYDGAISIVNGSPGWIQSGVPTRPSVTTSNWPDQFVVGACRLRGTVTPNGLAGAAWFEWGTTTSYGNSSGVMEFAAETAPITMEQVVSPISENGVTYHYRLVATNVAGLTVGESYSFEGGTFVITSLADDGPGTLRRALSGTGFNNARVYFATNGVIHLTSGAIKPRRTYRVYGPGPTNLIIDANHQSRIFDASESFIPNFLLSGMTLRNGRSPDGADSPGPGVAGAAGGPGGAVYANIETLTVSNCVFVGNSTGNGGKGYSPHDGSSSPTAGGPGGEGGAIFTFRTLQMYDSTIVSNYCGNGGAGGAGGFNETAGGAGGNGGHGGGVYAVAGLQYPKLVVRSTFSGNRAGDGGSGGAGINGVGGPGGPGGKGGSGGAIDPGTIELIYPARTTLQSTTVTRNRAGRGGDGGVGGGAHLAGAGGNGGNGGGMLEAPSVQGTHPKPIFQNSLFTENFVGAGGNSSAAPGSSGSGPNLLGAMTSQGYNLVSDVSGASGFNATGDLTGTSADPVIAPLGPLKFNGGPTPTHALLPGNPAIEAGDNALGGVDQRGFPRPFGPRVDIGAFEVDFSDFPPLTATPVGVSFGSLNSGLGNVPVTLMALVNPGGLRTTAAIELGLSPGYGSSLPTPLPDSGVLSLPANVTLPLSPGLVYYWRIVATNAAHGVASPQGTFTVPAVYPPGDINGDGLVDHEELEQVLANHFSGDAWLSMTNVAGLGGTNVTFALNPPMTGTFSVESSTNLMDWHLLGPALPRYQFNDTNSPSGPQRYYRLRWP